MTASTFPFWKEPSWERKWTKMIFISLGLHFLILALLLNLFPKGGVKRNLEPAYIVNLVSSPGEGPIHNKTKEIPSTPAPPPPRVEPKPIPLPKPVPEKPIVVNEDRSKTLDQAMEQLKKKVQREKSLEQTLNRLENKVKDDQTLEKALAQIESKKKVPSSSGTGTGVGVPGTISSSTPGSQDGLGIQFQLYHASLRSRIKRNWVLPEGLLKRNDISAEIMIRISRNGRIEDSRFERKSGLEAFDQEVLRTLKKSDPLPVLPEGYPKNSYEVVLTFHSKDLSGN